MCDDIYGAAPLFLRILMHLRLRVKTGSWNDDLSIENSTYLNNVGNPSHDVVCEDWGDCE